MQLLVLQADDYDWPTLLEGATLQERWAPECPAVYGSGLETGLAGLE